MTPFLLRAAFAALCALSLSGCLDSAKPILLDSQPLLGTKLKLQLYSLRKGVATEPERADYIWNDGLYRHAGGSMKDVAAFSMHPFESGTFIIQTAPGKPEQKIEYALMRRLAEGVYLVHVIDERDADEATRAANCAQRDKSSCRVERREQLLAFARATAARQTDEGGLALRLPDEPEPRKKRPRR